MTEVANFALKPDPQLCGCGCQKVGVLRAQPWRDGTHCIKRDCPCRRCLGKKSKRKGQRKQSKATTALGIPRSSISPGHEELLPGQVRTEVKAGAQIKAAVTAYLRMEAQSEAARPIGDNRPFIGVAMPDGSSDGIAMFRLSQIHNVVAALYEQLFEESA